MQRSEHTRRRYRTLCVPWRRVCSPGWPAGCTGAHVMTVTPSSVGGWRGTALLRRRSRRTIRFLTAVTIALIGLLVVVGLLLAWRDYTGRRTAVLDDARLRARAAAADADRFLRDR